MTDDIRWRKARRSGQQGNCVELAHTGDRLRDSKNPAGPILRANVTALIAAAKAGELDR